MGIGKARTRHTHLTLRGKRPMLEVPWMLSPAPRGGRTQHWGGGLLGRSPQPLEEVKPNTGGPLDPPSAPGGGQTNTRNPLDAHNWFLQSLQLRAGKSVLCLCHAGFHGAHPTVSGDHVLGDLASPSI